MKITIESTDTITTLVTEDHASVPARIWVGTTDFGAPVVVAITRVMVPESEPPAIHERFARELREAPTKEAAAGIPLRMIV